MRSLAQRSRDAAQKNAALADQSASSAKSLSADAGALQEQIGFFKIRESARRTFDALPEAQSDSGWRASERAHTLATVPARPAGRSAQSAASSAETQWSQF